MNRLLGLDLSTKKSGYSVFSNKGELLRYGCIECKLSDWRERVKFMQQEITKIIQEEDIDTVIIEDVPLSQANAKTTVQLSTLQGVIMALTTIYDIPLILVQPTSWRSKIGLFDGTAKGKTRIEMKKKSIEFANSHFSLQLKWVSDSSTKNDDDIADSVCLSASYFINEPIQRVGFGKRV